MKVSSHERRKMRRLAPYVASPGVTHWNTWVQEYKHVESSSEQIQGLRNDGGQTNSLHLDCKNVPALSEHLRRNPSSTSASCNNAGLGTSQASELRSSLKCEV